MNSFFLKIFYKSTFAIIALVLFSCESDIQTVRLITKRSEIADLTAKNVHMTQSDSSKVLIEIQSPLIKKYSNAEEPYTEFPEGLNVVFFSNYPDTSSYIVCDYAVNYESKNYWVAKRNVIAQNNVGEKLNTEYLIWDEKKEIIYSDKSVTITTAEDIIFGEGFESDQTFSNWNIKKVKGTIVLEE